MNLFDFTLRLKGFPIREATRHLEKLQSFSNSDFADSINRHKKEIVAFHLENNSFYSGLAKNASISDWNSLPVLTKNDLQQPLDKRLSKGYLKKSVYINKTSGSGGHPFVFAKDKFSHALTWAMIKNRFAWHDIDLNTSLQARFYGIPLDVFGYQKERLKDRLSNRYRFPIFDLSDQKLEEFFKKFKKTPFDYINGYTSSIVLFAKYLQRKGVVLKEICPTLKVCMVTSEMLFETDKTLLESQFGVPVVNEYGASELDLIAYTDTENQFIVNSETLFVEILDESDIPVPNGETGKIVITSLYNKAHPFIRYDIGDTGSFSESSTLQKPILKDLIGRTNDVALLPSGKSVPGLTFYYVTKSIIEDDGNVKEFVVVQTQKNTFEINYVSAKTLSQNEEIEIQKAMEIYLEKGLTLILKRVGTLDRSRRGKLKQFTSLILD
ncbi:MAG: phenylacetate--CoA ligase family protein [Flavobacteriaceae bacterium]|nr:phenylacetate--CoA ligase family protein [Flavobacteriaceae bacterium]